MVDWIVQKNDKRQKELVKATETPKEKRAQRLAKKLEEELGEWNVY